MDPDLVQPLGSLDELSVQQGQNGKTCVLTSLKQLLQE